MDYFKINYSKLENIQEIKFYKLSIGLFIVFILFIIVSKSVTIYEKFECYGIYTNDMLTIKIDNTLSEKMNESEYIIFNKRNSKFKIKEYGEYEILNNVVYQEISIITDNNFYNNEVGIVEFYYDKKSVFEYIINLFK